MIELSFWQFVIMAATVAFVIGGGIWAARSVHSADGYSVGGRSAGAGLVAGSIAGTCVGGGATVGTAQLATSVGLSAIWFTVGTGIALILMGLFYARPLRKTALTTVAQYLVLNYGTKAGEFTGAVSSLGILFSAVASALPGIFLVSALTGLSPVASAAVLLVLVAAYAFFGGMKSAGVGGILKMCIIWGGMFLTGASAFMMLSEPEAMAAIPDVFWNPFGIGFSAVAVNVLSLLVGMLCTQTYIQAIFSAATPRAASFGAFIAAFVTIPVGLPCAFIGMYMHAAHPEVLPLLALPTFLLEHQGVLLGSIAMGGIILSLVSSIAGLSLGIGTMVTRDIISRFSRKVRDEYQLPVMRGVVLFVIALALTIAVLNHDSQVLFWNYLSMALRGAGIFLPLTIAVFFPSSIERHWAFSSMVLATLVTLAATLLGSTLQPLFLGLAISIALLLPGFLKARRNADS